MDRTTWKQQRRLWNEVQMDTIYARQYDADWGGYINPSHRAMVERLLTLCRPGGYILDAACGTGKYWSMLLEQGFSVQGTDQSQQMMQQAHAKFPNVPLEHVGLQELTFSDTFDAFMCMDAMEMVFPEDWPVVLGNFRQALHENGLLYFTVEIETEGHCKLLTTLENAWACHSSMANTRITAAITTIQPMSRYATGSRKHTLLYYTQRKVMATGII